jgi:hypothetical protein
MEEKKYAPIETDEIIIETTEEYPNRAKSLEVPITLWFFRFIFTAALITVWCLSVNFSTLLFKDFLYSCTTYECSYPPELQVKYVNDSFCSFNLNQDLLVTYYLPTRCDPEINDAGQIMSTMTWLIPFFGLVFSGEGDFERYWRRFCFFVEICINCLLIWNKIYVFVFVDAFLLYCWFLATPFMCNNCKKVTK